MQLTFIHMSSRTIIALICVAVVSANPKYHLRDDQSFIHKPFVSEYRKAAVASFGPTCAQIASDIMQYKGGSAVDGAIATLFCEGVASPHALGLGGGFLMVIYDAPNDEFAFLNAREMAPAAANCSMYGGDANLSLRGGLSVAVPGELLGYWEAHQKYGRARWRDLIEPSIKLCYKGAYVTKYLENNLESMIELIRKEPSMSEVFINPRTNDIYRAGDRIRRPRLAKTLTKLANAQDPAELFYNGSIAKHLVDEIQGFGGIITREDFSNYRVKWSEPIESQIGNLTMHTAPPPGSGHILTLIMNVLDGFKTIDDPKIKWQRIIETFKWAYAKRTELGDTDFVDIEDLLDNLSSPEYASKIRSMIEDDKTYNDPKHYGAVTSLKEDHGTGHISVLAPDGSAVAVTTTINQILGAAIRSKSTGLIFNDEMDDFSSPGIDNGFGLPPSPNNYIAPYKRPVSSMVPTIILDENRNVRLVVGAAGGSKITSTVALLLTLYFYDNYTIKQAIDAYRIHHQLFPMQVQYEPGFSPDVLNYLHEIGHNLTTPTGIISAAVGVAVKDGKISANADYRREGTVAGF